MLVFVMIAGASGPIPTVVVVERVARHRLADLIQPLETKHPSILHRDVGRQVGRRSDLHDSHDLPPLRAV